MKQLKQPKYKILLLLLGFWLVSAQMLVLAHDSTHAIHIHKQFCDDLGAIGGNLVGVASDFTLPDPEPAPPRYTLPSEYQTWSQPTLAYHSRAPPSFT